MRLTYYSNTPTPGLLIEVVKGRSLEPESALQVSHDMTGNFPSSVMNDEIS
jgi:hypothetical protein